MLPILTGELYYRLVYDSSRNGACMHMWLEAMCVQVHLPVCVPYAISRIPRPV
jgi:hypothetical protein